MSTNAPVFVQFCAAIRAQARELGYVEEQKAQWVNFTHPTTEHKISIQKKVADLPRIESTLEIPVEAPEVVELIKLNGRMRTVLLPTPEVVVKALQIGADPRTPKTLSRRKKGAKVAPKLEDLLVANGLAADEEPAEEEMAAE